MAINLQNSTQSFIFLLDLISSLLPFTDTYFVRNITLPTHLLPSHPVQLLSPPRPLSKLSYEGIPADTQCKKWCVANGFTPGTIDAAVKISAPSLHFMPGQETTKWFHIWPVCVQHWWLPGFPHCKQSSTEEHRIPDCKAITLDFLSYFRRRNISLK